MTERQPQDFDAPFWTIDQAAAHFGISRRSVRRYISEGLPAYFGESRVKPKEIAAEVVRRKKAVRSTRAK